MKDLRTSNTAPINLLESLEPRIAPAVLVNASTVQYTDVDNDLVTVKFSGKVLDSDPVFLDQVFGKGFVDGDLSDPQQLKSLNLTNPIFQGVSVSITAKMSGGGDGLVNVGEIIASGNTLNKVTVNGDLGSIVVGINDHVVGLNLLKVDSMGVLGTTTGASSLSSNFFGGAKVITINGDLDGASLFNSNTHFGKISIGGDFIGGDTLQSGYIGSGTIGSIIIKGDLLGGVGELSGRINANGDVGKIIIGGDIVGGSNNSSGVVFVNGTLGNIRVGGDIVGGTGSSTGVIFANDGFAKIFIGGSVIGNDGSNSGLISTQGDIKSFTIKGDLLGGIGSDSASIYAGGDISKLAIGGDLSGGKGVGSASIFVAGTIGNLAIKGDVTGSSSGGTGTIHAGESLAKVTIGGDVSGGSGTNSGRISASESIGKLTIGGNVESDFGGQMIQAGSTIGFLTVKGDVTGASPTKMTFITSVGTSTAPAFGKIQIGGSVEFASILAGYNLKADPVYADAQIGKVTVMGGWTASNLVAGASNALPPNFGNNNDSVIAGGDPALLSRIASITIKGAADGTIGGTDSYGIVAQQIGKVSVGGSKAFVPELGFTSLGTTNDLKIHVLPA